MCKPSCVPISMSKSADDEGHQIPTLCLCSLDSSISSFEIQPVSFSDDSSSSSSEVLTESSSSDSSSRSSHIIFSAPRDSVPESSLSLSPQDLTTPSSKTRKARSNPCPLRALATTIDTDRQIAYLQDNETRSGPK
jgi:hypothetical protein